MYNWEGFIQNFSSYEPPLTFKKSTNYFKLKSTITNY